MAVQTRNGVEGPSSDYLQTGLWRNSDANRPRSRRSLRKCWTPLGSPTLFTGSDAFGCSYSCTAPARSMFDPLRNDPRSQNTRRLGSTETTARILSDKFRHGNCVRGTVGSRRNPADPTYCFARSRRTAAIWILVRRAAAHRKAGRKFHSSDSTAWHTRALCNQPLTNSNVPAATAH